MERNTWKENIKFIVQMTPDPPLLVIVKYVLYLILVNNSFDNIGNTIMTKDVMIGKIWKKLSLTHLKSWKLLPALPERRNAISSLTWKKPKKTHILTVKN